MHALCQEGPAALQELLGVLDRSVQCGRQVRASETTGVPHLNRFIVPLGEAIDAAPEDVEFLVKCVTRLSMQSSLTIRTPATLNTAGAALLQRRVANLGLVMTPSTHVGFPLKMPRTLRLALLLQIC